MKTNLTASLLRAAALAATLFASSTLTFANDPTPADRAANLLAVKGGVPVKNAGPYVEAGTYRIQVAVKLGQPTAKLADGSWLYDHYQVDDSDARGTLVVRFNQGRVSDLALVTPAVAMAMSAPKKANNKILVADRK